MAVVEGIERAARLALLAELYVPVDDEGEAAVAVDAVRRITDRAGSLGVDADPVDSLYLPGEELLLVLFQSVSEDAVAAVLDAAGMDAIRISACRQIVIRPSLPCS